MHVIGITGGIASGKTWVSERLQELGAARVDIDRLGHEALRETSVKDAARRQWGDAVFDESDEVDRARLAAIVFAPTEAGVRERRFLERLVHPRMTRDVERLLRDLDSSGKMAVVLDAPLLIEAGWISLCSKVVWVESPRQMRLARAAERGWSEEEFTAREASQDSLDSKRFFADVIVENAGDQSKTQHQIEAFWRSLSEG